MRVESRRNYKHWVTAAARTVENLSSLHDDDEVGGGDDDDNDDDVGGDEGDDDAEPPGQCNLSAGWLKVLSRKTHLSRFTCFLRINISIL